MLVRSKNRWLYRDVTRQTKNCSIWSAFESVLPLWWWPAHLSRDNLGGSTTLERCTWSRICFQSWWSLGTTIRLSNHKTPVWSVWKHLYFSSLWANFYFIILIPSSCSCAKMILSWSIYFIAMWFKHPCGIISSFDFLISLHKVSLNNPASAQWQCDLQLSASATTFALLGC